MQEGFGVMSKTKGSNSIRTAKRVVRSYLMFSQGYTVKRIAYDLEVSERMIYYYIRAWYRNKDYYIKIAQDAGFIKLLDAAWIEQPDIYQEKFKPKILK